MERSLAKPSVTTWHGFAYLTRLGLTRKGVRWSITLRRRWLDDMSDIFFFFA